MLIHRVLGEAAHCIQMAGMFISLMVMVMDPRVPTLSLNGEENALSVAVVNTMEAACAHTACTSQTLLLLLLESATVAAAHLQDCRP
jgi:hypothetical protein